MIVPIIFTNLNEKKLRFILSRMKRITNQLNYSIHYSVIALHARFRKERHNIRLLFGKESTNRKQDVINPWCSYTLRLECGHAACMFVLVCERACVHASLKIRSMT